MKSTIPKRLNKERVEIYNKKFGVIFNGEDNLKPIQTENLIDDSPTASQCADLLHSFISGGGFAVDMSEVNLSDVFWEDTTPDDLLYEIGDEYKYHAGVFIWVGYNSLYQKDSFKVIPYSLCRVGRKDNEGFAGKILVSENGWGKSLKKEEVDIYNSYNPNPDVIKAQVEDAGGWDKYRGQILFYNPQKKYTYPIPFIDKAYNYAEVEYSLGRYYLGVVNRSFEDITIIRHRKFPDPKDEKSFIKNIEELSGIENASSKLVVQDDWDDERKESGNFKFDTLKNNVTPDKYKHFEESSSNYIRKAFLSIPPQLVDYISGKLGNTSGEDLIKAQSIYNANTAIERSRLERLFKELFWNFRDNINPTNDWSIKQYKLLDDGTVNQ